MIRYQRLDGVNIETANGLPSVTVTEEGRAIGSIPAWTAMLQPEYIKTGRPLDRVNGKYTDVKNNAVIGTFENGAPSFDLNLSNDGFDIEAKPNIGINRTEWTFFSVFNIGADDFYVDLIRPRSNISGVGLRISYVASSGYIYVYGSRDATDERLNSGQSVKDVPTLLEVTFSESRGLKIILNGIVIAENTADKRPLSDGVDAGQWFLLSRFTQNENSVKVGMTGVLGVDLSAPENTGHRRAIEKFLMNKYGIVG